MQRCALVVDVSDRKTFCARGESSLFAYGVAWLDIICMAGACPKAGTGQRATSPGMEIEVNGYSWEGGMTPVLIPCSRSAHDQKGGKGGLVVLLLAERAR